MKLTLVSGAYDLNVSTTPSKPRGRARGFAM